MKLHFVRRFGKDNESSVLYTLSLGSWLAFPEAPKLEDTLKVSLMKAEHSIIQSYANMHAKDSIESILEEWGLNYHHDDPT